MTWRMPAAMSEPGEPEQDRRALAVAQHPLEDAGALAQGAGLEGRPPVGVEKLRDRRAAGYFYGRRRLPRSAFLRLRSTPTAASCVYSRALPRARVFFMPCLRTSGKNSVRGHRGRVAGVDVDRRDSVGAGSDGREQRRDAFERGAVSPRRRDGDDRTADQAGDDREERRLHAGDRDDDVGLLDLLDRESRRSTPATPTSGTSVEEMPRYSSVARASSATAVSEVPAVTTETVPSMRRIGFPTESWSVADRASYLARPGSGAAETSSHCRASGG